MTGTTGERLEALPWMDDVGYCLVKNTVVLISNVCQFCVGKASLFGPVYLQTTAV